MVQLCGSYSYEHTLDVINNIVVSRTETAVVTVVGRPINSNGMKHNVI